MAGPGFADGPAARGLKAVLAMLRSPYSGLPLVPEGVADIEAAWRR